MERSPKNFVLQFGSLVALYLSISAILSLLFGVIDVSFPDDAESIYAYEAAQSTIRFGIAMLIVFFPTFAVLTRIVNSIKRREGGEYLGLTKWLVYISLLVAGMVLLGDLVAVVLAYLNGELTTRFILKALSLLFVVGLSFSYYLLDIRGYWKDHEQQSIYFGLIVALCVFVTLVVGIKNTDTPSEVREARIDQQQIDDLMQIQAHIEEYYRINNMLPENIDLAFGDISAPTAPESRAAYTYTNSKTSFSLCAEFTSETPESMRSFSYPIEKGIIKNPYNWEHGSGNVCFERYLESL